MKNEGNLIALSILGLIIGITLIFDKQFSSDANVIGILMCIISGGYLYSIRKKWWIIWINE